MPSNEFIRRMVWMATYLHSQGYPARWVHALLRIALEPGIFSPRKDCCRDHLAWWLMEAATMNWQWGRLTPVQRAGFWQYKHLAGREDH